MSSQISTLINVIHPAYNKDANRVLKVLCSLSGEMPTDIRELWEAKFEELYGELSGQRAVTPQVLETSLGVSLEDTPIKDAIFALQSYFALVAEAISIAVVKKEALPNDKEDAANQGRHSLYAISRGIVLEGLGITSFSRSYRFDWYSELLDAQSIQSAVAVIRAIRQVFTEYRFSTETYDPIYSIYLSLFPKNVLHSSGEFYTPPWLASLLLRELEYSGEQTLIDPFCGSGIFAATAIQKYLSKDEDVREVLARMILIDLNPLACLQAQVNLLITAKNAQVNFERGLALPILNANALVPALTMSTYGASMFPKDVLIFGKHFRASTTNQDKGLVSPSDTQGMAKRLGVTRWLSPDITNFTFIGSELQKGTKLNETLHTALTSHALVCNLNQADILATNPPWVGWEYIPRKYRESLSVGWDRYGLFTAKGREKAFLKEDLSTLATIVSLDRFLKTSGHAALVLKPSLMKSSLAAKGLRRLSIYPNEMPLRLEEVRTFSKLNVFENAITDVMTWQLKKGEKTQFPVNAEEWVASKKIKTVRNAKSLAQIEQSVIKVKSTIRRLKSNDDSSPWIINHLSDDTGLSKFLGESEFTARVGLFTGGANAVYYVSPINGDSPLTPTHPNLSWYKNVVERAKRTAPERLVQLENELIYPIVRGKDVFRWHATPKSYVICPHTIETKMYPIPETEFENNYPHTFRYFNEMREVIDSRKGFSGWEDAAREKAFYAIQRIGEYSFSPFKVVWRYIADDFIAAVVRPTQNGKPVMVNDKVISISCETEAEAYYLCGLLSSYPVRLLIISGMTGTQISVSAIKHIKLSKFDDKNEAHKIIANHCLMGHQFVLEGKVAQANAAIDQINHSVAKLYNLSPKQLSIITDALKKKVRSLSFVRDVECSPSGFNGPQLSGSAIC